MSSRPTFETLLDDWLETGPMSAPVGVLEGVLAGIPATPQRRAGWLRGWQLAPMAGPVRAAFGLAIAVVIGLAALVFLVNRPGPIDVGSSPSVPPPSATPSASTAASASASASASTAATGSGCPQAGLSVKILSWEGAAGSRIATVELTNTSPASCTIDAAARPQLVDGTGTVLIDGPAAGGVGSITVDPGVTLHVLVQAANYCGPDPVAPVTIAFIEADGSTIRAQPASPTDATVPPCNGAGAAASIEMQAWGR